MAYTDIRTRDGQLRFLNANWSRMIGCWLREREWRGRGALVVFTDQAGVHGRMVPFRFASHEELVNLIPRYGGSEIDQTVRRSQPRCPIAVLFVRTADSGLNVDCCEIRLRSAAE